ncbi:MAG: hypothetical protein [Arizlama microvirus]|nr:MAG: hypothetical protein [Arizlama microvirus]
MIVDDCNSRAAALAFLSELVTVGGQVRISSVYDKTPRSLRVCDLDELYGLLRLYFGDVNVT